MLLVSFLLVIVATIFLLSGLFLTKDLPLIFVSIGCSIVAGLVLVVAVLKSRPRPVEGIEPMAPGMDLAADARAGAGPAPLSGARASERAGARGFPIPDYDNLEVVEILPLLGDLDGPQLRMVRDREASGRAHPWVLARVDALLESEAETGEIEWAPAQSEEPAEADEAWSGSAAGSEWGAGDPEWAATDFPLEGGGDSGYGDVEVMRDFPIDRYDDLRANEILPLLAQLDTEDLKMVREEEAAGKARTSVLSRIDVLLARSGPSAAAAASRPSSRTAKAPSRAARSLPIPDYDSLTVAQINAYIPGLSVDELKAVRNYEKRHKARNGVLSRIDSVLARYR